MRKNAIDELETSESNKYLLRKLYNQLTEEQKGQFTRCLRSGHTVDGKSVVITDAIQYAGMCLREFRKR